LTQRGKEKEVGVCKREIWDTGRGRASAVNGKSRSERGFERENRSRAVGHPPGKK